MKPLRDVNSTAQVCGISPWTVRSYIKQGKLRALHIGRRVLIEEAEIERFLEQCRSAVNSIENPTNGGPYVEQHN